MTVSLALALLDAQQHALAFDVGNLEVGDLGHAQAGTIGDAERGLVLDTGCGLWRDYLDESGASIRMRRAAG